MVRYKLSKKTKKGLETRGFILICKICECPIQVGDWVESKAQRRGQSKLYHATCYDKSHFESDDDEEGNWKKIGDTWILQDLPKKTRKSSNKFKKKKQRKNKRKRRLRRKRNK